MKSGKPTTCSLCSGKGYIESKSTTLCPQCGMMTVGISHNCHACGVRLTRIDKRDGHEPCPACGETGKQPPVVNRN